MLTDFDPLQQTNTFRKDPYKYLGYGLYFSLLTYLLLLFIIISLCLIPLLWLFHTGSVYDRDSMASYTMGNMGYSSQQCVTTPLSYDSLGFNCQGGKIRTLDFVGINPVTGDNPTSCVYNDMSSSCTPAINGLQFRINFYDECMHKSKCSMWNFREKYV